MATDLVNKTILVTGAGQGIGNQLCKDLAAAGVHVIAVDRNEAQLKELCAEYPSIKSIVVDLTDWQKTREKLSNVPMLDGLVNNAGVTIVKPFLEFTEKEFDFIFNVNIKAVFHVTQTLVPRLNTGASIVNMSSIASLHTFMGHTVYSAAKSGVDALTRVLAFELSDRKIRVNSVHPTAVLTDMGKYAWSDPAKSGPLLARIPLHRFCEVHEVIDSIIYFLGPRSSFVNGHHLKLEGGYAAA